MLASLREDWIDLVILTFLGATALSVVFVRSVFGSVMLMGLFSLLSATFFVVLDAVDVAFTEASVGAGVSTVLFLGALALIPTDDRPRMTAPLMALLVCASAGGLLVYATLDMPHYGDPDAPIHHHVADYYIEESYHETHIPNLVTTILASYRGYDTLGETFVVFTAAVSVILLLGRGRMAYRRKRKAELKDGDKKGGKDDA